MVASKSSKSAQNDWAKVVTTLSLLGNAIQALDRIKKSAQLNEATGMLSKVIAEKDQLKSLFNKLSQDYSQMKAEVASLDEINRQLKLALIKSQRERELLEARLTRKEVRKKSMS